MAGAEGAAGIALAIPAIIDLCIEYGKKLKLKCHLFMHAEEEIRIQGFIVDLVTGGLHDILDYFKVEANFLNLSFATELRDLTRVLQNTLCTAIEAFPDDSFIEKRSKFSKLKYAVYDARCIQDATKDLEAWYGRFRARADTYLTYVVIRPSASTALVEPAVSPKVKAAPAILKQIRKDRRTAKVSPLLLQASTDIEYTNVAYSPLFMPRDPSRAHEALLEYRTYEGVDRHSIDRTRALVRDIAEKLRDVDESSMGILQCQGFSDEPLHDRFALHFTIPPGKQNPKSLRALLSDPRNKDPRIGKRHSLSDRIHLAQAVASAVLYVHCEKLVHKNIRPENILIFEPQPTTIHDSEYLRKQAGPTAAGPHQYPNAIGEPYLVGYDGSRFEKAETHWTEVDEWKKRIYFSPERQDVNKTRAKFSMKHDVYSLGVMLLEIGLWEDFANAERGYGKALKAAENTYELLMQLTARLPIQMGDKYRDAVVSCLMELKEEEDRRDLDDEDGIVVGSAYMVQVMSKLEKISV